MDPLRYKEGSHWKNPKPKPAYRSWKSMKVRCNNANFHSYNLYGGRGIVVCERWNSFQNFLEDMGEPPTPKHTLDRINSNGNYCPENCRWATRYEQSRNTSQNVFVTINNCRLCVSDWSKWCGVPVTNILSRKYYYGWTWPDSSLTPSCKKKRHKKLSLCGITWDEGTDY